MYVFPFQPTASLGGGEGAAAASSESTTAGLFAGLLDEMLALLVAPVADTEASAGTGPASEIPVNVDSAASTTDEAVVVAANLSSDAALAATAVTVKGNSANTTGNAEAESSPDAPLARAPAQPATKTGIETSIENRTGVEVRAASTVTANAPPVAIDAPETLPVASDADSADERSENQAASVSRLARAVAAPVEGEASRQAVSSAPAVSVQARLPDGPVLARNEAAPPGAAARATADTGAQTSDGDDASFTDDRPHFAARVATASATPEQAAAGQAFEVVQLNAGVQGTEVVRTAPPEAQPLQGPATAAARAEIGTASVDATSTEGRVAAEPKAVLETAIRGVRHLVTRGEQVITVRLVPESLGELHVTVRHGGDTLEVHLASARATVREALEGHLPAMREALAREGIEVTRAVVTSAPPSADFSANANGSAQRESHSQQGRSPNGDAPQRYASNPGAEQSNRQARHEGALDVRV